MRRVLIISGLVVLLAVVGLGVWVYKAWFAPIPEELRAKPPPRESIPPEENAITNYMAALELCREPTEEESRALREFLRPGSKTKPDEIAHLIADNQAALAELRKGIAKDRAEMPEAEDFTTTSHFPYGKGFEMGRLLVAEGKVRETNGSSNQALSAYLDCIEFGQDIGKGTGPQGMLTGVIAQLIGYRALQPLLRSESPARESYERAISRLARGDASRPSLLEVLDIWVYDQQTLFEYLADNPDERMMILQLAKEQFARGLGANQLARLLALRQIKEALQELGLRREELRGLKTGSYREIVTTVRRWADRDAETGNAFVVAWFLISERTPARPTSPVAHCRASMLLAALQLYKMDNGRMPGSLSQLVPEYLPELPEDPFSDEDFIYRREGEEWKLYSVGPDMKDNGGVHDYNDRPKAVEEEETDLLYHRGPEQG